ncbi:pentatricopeptide repeat-containing protein At4g02750-like [Arachis ipaensis]|uniref:pentatricopeptide repeat-containing protein At4g02750-like n=1 Tax=Arachis ipaensis TaxID=130454 RepID=UPI0007AF6CEF|nr:pentatricopeptide repeat-containing protein At4g02750-like [Arachis ipaensis]XP_025640769.1 pentatricopeptide repeat-containing protein At4g02750-like [Arachis hypogaea]
MVVGYVKVGNMVEAKRLFDEMPQRNVASWNAMIWDFVKVKNLGNARVVLDAMPEKSVASFTIMIDGYAKAGDTYMYKVATSLEKSLQGFEYVYGDIVSGVIDVNELGFLVKHMECMVRKMDRYVSNTKNLYSEMEVLNQLEQAMNKFQNNQNDESRRVIEQKLASQRQDIGGLFHACRQACNMAPRAAATLELSKNLHRFTGSTAPRPRRVGITTPPAC